MSADVQSVLLVGIVLGIVQGVSEWLPVSSKTQIILVSTILFGLTFNQSYTLGLFLELGTFFAAVIYFRRELILALSALIGRGGSVARLLLKYLVVVTVITGVMGIVIYKGVESITLGRAIGIPMILLGIVLLLDGFFIRYSRSRSTPRKSLEKMTLKELLIIGFAQGLSAFPGVSRSGVTVSTMLVLGTEAKEAFRLSFLALIPASLGATLVALLFSSSSVLGSVNTLSSTSIAVALVISFVVGLGMIRWLLKIASAERITTLVFALGILAIAGGLVGVFFGSGLSFSSP